jgi:hypothetical protein
VWDCIEHEMAAKAENKSYRRMAWQEARDGGADDGVRAKDHLLFSVKSRRSNEYKLTDLRLRQRPLGLRRSGQDNGCED